MKELKIEEIDDVLGYPILIKCDLSERIAKDLSFIPKENVFLVRCLDRNSKKESAKTFDREGKELALHYYNALADRLKNLSCDS